MSSSQWGSGARPGGSAPASPAPVPPIAKRLVPIGVGLLLALGLAVFGTIVARRLWRPAEDVAQPNAAHVTATLQEGLAELPRASALCGYVVTAVRNIQVGDVRTDGVGSAGTGTASVTLESTPAPGVAIPVAGPCRGSYRYEYAIRMRREGQRRVEETFLQDLQLVRPLAIGTSLQGTLQVGDERLSDGALMDDYAIELRAGQSVTVVVRGGPEVGGAGTSLDVMAVLLTVEGEHLLLDDDGAGNLNARIVFTPGSDGTYILRVTHALSGVHQGPYTLQTLAGAHPEAT
ncbi:MAG: PPC domain-containing protein [Sandaracinaceae bacterium]|nr:PPC domain-containing protein [Sandaracinaceae bacterium]